MNPRHLSILQHTLGLDQYGQPPKGRVPCSDDDFPNCYRNNYCTGPEGSDFATLCDLVTCGLMTDAGAKEVFGGMHVFHATQKGYVSPSTPSDEGATPLAAFPRRTGSVGLDLQGISQRPMEGRERSPRRSLTN